MTAFSPSEIKARIRLEQIIAQDWKPPVKRYATWWTYFCPFHENMNTPALGVNLSSGTFKCFSGSCGVHGDLFTWYMLRNKVDFKTALAYFREQLPQWKASSPPLPPDPEPARPEQPPDDVWQLQAMTFLQRSQFTLWEPAGEPGRMELARRGIQEDTARQWSLGYNPKWCKESGKLWGMSGSKVVWLPQGLVIPAFVGFDLWSLKVRIFGIDGRPVHKQPGKSKYLQILGSRPALFGIDHYAGQKGLLMAESELDAILAWQIGGDLLDVASLGGAGKRLDNHWIPYLLPYQRIFLAYDQDSAGRNGAQKLAALSPRLVVSPSPAAGDLTDFLCAGGDLQAMMEKMSKSLM